MKIQSFMKIQFEFENNLFLNYFRFFYFINLIGLSEKSNESTPQKLVLNLIRRMGQSDGIPFTNVVK